MLYEKKFRIITKCTTPTSHVFLGIPLLTRFVRNVSRVGEEDLRSIVQLRQCPVDTHPLSLLLTNKQIPFFFFFWSPEQ